LGDASNDLRAATDGVDERQGRQPSWVVRRDPELLDELRHVSPRLRRRVLQ
jgi:hypothetical protein